MQDGFPKQGGVFWGFFSFSDLGQRETVKVEWVIHYCFNEYNPRKLRHLSCTLLKLVELWPTKALWEELKTIQGVFFLSVEREGLTG